MIKRIIQFAIILLLVFGASNVHSIELSADFDDCPMEDLDIE